MHGFQLWANLPAHLKMTRPRYQDVPASAIPEVIDDDGTRVRVICGEFWGKAGPVDGVAAEPRYLDVSVPAGKKKRLKVEDFRQAFAYIFEGSGDFASASSRSGRYARRRSTARRRWCATRLATARWSCSGPAMRSASRRATRACASSWSPAAATRADRLARADRHEHSRPKSARR